MNWHDKSLKPKIVAIIQARLTSTRLPRKVLKKIGKKTILQHVIDRVRQVKNINKVVVAAPHGIPFKRAELFIGNEKDVLTRYYDCAKHYGAEIIVRITSDCPLIDPEIISYAINYFKQHNFPYVYFAPVDGLDVEVFTINILSDADYFAFLKLDREHVTSWMKREIKLSIDTKEDLDRVRRWFGKIK